MTGWAPSRALIVSLVPLSVSLSVSLFSVADGGCMEPPPPPMSGNM